MFMPGCGAATRHRNRSTELEIRVSDIDVRRVGDLWLFEQSLLTGPNRIELDVCQIEFHLELQGRPM